MKIPPEPWYVNVFTRIVAFKGIYLSVFHSRVILAIWNFYNENLL